MKINHFVHLDLDGGKLRKDEETLNFNCCENIMDIGVLFVFYAVFNDHISQMCQSTVDSRYLELRNLEFYELRSVYLNQKYILIAVSSHNLGLETFLQVQITQSAN